MCDDKGHCFWCCPNLGWPKEEDWLDRLPAWASTLIIVGGILALGAWAGFIFPALLLWLVTR
jgi:hypothetical protein